MRTYRVYIVDKFTKMPLGSCDIKAWTKSGAKRKVFNQVCEKDTSYILTVGLAPKQ